MTAGQHGQHHIRKDHRHLADDLVALGHSEKKKEKAQPRSRSRYCAGKRCGALSLALLALGMATFAIRLRRICADNNGHLSFTLALAGEGGNRAAIATLLLARLELSYLPGGGLQTALDPWSG